MDMKSDRYGYLRKTGAIGVCNKVIPVSGSTRGKGSLGSDGNNAATPAKAKLVGTDDKRIKKTTASLKQGGSEKELRAGHNSFGDLASGGLSSLLGGNDGPSASTLKAEKRQRTFKKIAKAGGKVSINAETNPILAARLGKKQGIQAAKASGDSVADARKAGRTEVQAAKKTRAGFTGAEKQASKRAYKDVSKAAGQQNRATKRETMQSARTQSQTVRTQMRDTVRGPKKNKRFV